MPPAWPPILSLSMGAPLCSNTLKTPPHSPDTLTCLCGFNTNSQKRLDLHINITLDSSLPHGLQLPNLIRSAGSFLVLDGSSYVITGGAMRLPPSGIPSLESDPAEIETLPYALLHSIDSTPPEVSTITFNTDSLNTVTAWDTFNSPTTSPRHRIRLPLYHYLLDLQAAQGLSPNVLNWSIQHSPKEKALTLADPLRRTPTRIANAVVNAGAQTARDNGRQKEGKMIKTVIGTPLVLSPRWALFLGQSILHNPIKGFQHIEGSMALSSCLLRNTTPKPPTCIRTPLRILDGIIDGKALALTIQRCTPQGQNHIFSHSLGRHPACYTDLQMHMTTKQRKEVQSLIPGAQSIASSTDSKVDLRCTLCGQHTRDTPLHFQYECKAFKRHQALAVSRLAAELANSGSRCWGCPQERIATPLIPPTHPLLLDLSSGFTTPPDKNLARVLIQDKNNNPKFIILSTTVEGFQKLYEPHAPLRDSILKIYKHHNEHPQASIARMIPGKILSELISRFDMKQQALCSPLTPSSASHDDTASPPSIYAPEISYIQEDIHAFAKYYKGTIDDPSNPSWANTPFPDKTYMVINNPGEPFLSNILRKCRLSAAHNRTVMQIIGDSLPDYPLRACTELKHKTCSQT
ncbi:hypothetical protein T484DRAFT_1756405 [Baffinella frigidus]|nr:hypothetical protein T484DRAFT_1756405 [Cryptophyta sp. CCMP2293]